MSGARTSFKVAHVVRRFAFEEWGGTETVVWNSARHLEKHDVESVILATRACSATGDEVRDGIPIRRFDYFYPYWPLSVSAKRALDKKGGSPISSALAAALREGDRLKRTGMLLAAAESGVYPADLALIHLTRAAVGPQHAARLRKLAGTRRGELIPALLCCRSAD